MRVAQEMHTGLDLVDGVDQPQALERQRRFIMEAKDPLLLRFVQCRET